jgi:hypothetical protein
MTEEKEAFLSRWSRLKSESREEEPGAPPPAAPEPAPLPELPRVEALTPDSDFRPFMDPRVDAGTRREALKKLFADARFNVPDPFEAYSEDYTGGEPIPMELLKTLNQARRLLFEETEKVAQAPAEEKPAPDGAGRQDA